MEGIRKTAKELGYKEGQLRKKLIEMNIYNDELKVNPEAIRLSIAAKRSAYTKSGVKVFHVVFDFNKLEVMINNDEKLSPFEPTVKEEIKTFTTAGLNNEDFPF